MPAFESVFCAILIAFGLVVVRGDQTSVYLSYFFFGTLIAVFALVARRVICRRYSRVGSYAILGAGLFGASGLLLLGPLGCSNSSAEQEWQIDPPLRDGAFFVIQGGSNVILNNHRSSPKATAQRYAVDLSKLSIFGRRTSTILPTNSLTDYLIYGEPVFSPCRGSILLKADGFDDQPIGRSDLNNPAGNYVAIGCDGGNTVVLAHLRRGIEVELGSHVVSGQRIGAVGNSGNTTEPHLHIHALSGIVTNEREALFVGQGIEIKIKNKCLYRNRTLEL